MAAAPIAEITGVERVGYIGSCGLLKHVPRQLRLTLRRVLESQVEIIEQGLLL